MSRFPKTRRRLSAAWRNTLSPPRTASSGAAQAKEVVRQEPGRPSFVLCRGSRAGGLNLTFAFDDAREARVLAGTGRGAHPGVAAARLGASCGRRDRLERVLLARPPASRGAAQPGSGISRAL